MKKYILLASAALFFHHAQAQSQDSVTFKDYQNAESFLGYNTAKLISGGVVRPNWLAGDHFWFENKTANGTQFLIVDPAKKSNKPAFDHQKLAVALSKMTGKTYKADQLPIQFVSIADDEKSMHFNLDKNDYNYTFKTNKLVVDNEPPTVESINRRSRGSVESPNGKLSAFIKDFNLWVKNLETGKETQLTTDGVEDYGYATDNAGWTHSDAAILRWSPDSKKIATFKQDQRNVNEMYLVTTNVGAPKLQKWKYPFVGDKYIPMIERVIIDIDNPKVIKLDVPADPHRASLSDDISSSGTFDDVDWTADASQLAFLSTSRDHKIEKFRIADAATGKVREVFEEVVATQYESGQGAINWRYLANSNEIIWYSERDDWGHLYLYDSQTGKLKNQITKGDFVVTKLVKVDEKNRLLYFLADGKDAKNPYFTHFFSIGFDGKSLKDLTEDAGNHQISFTPSEKYLIDTYSQPNVPQVTILKDINGKLITELAKTDISQLTAMGWKAPSPVKLMTADGKTAIYGLVFTPTQMIAGKKYPVIDYIYPGPQGGSVGSWSFSASRGDHQALAELGFIVVVIEGTSNPNRSKSFHDMSYGNMSINTLPDQVTAIQQLAKTYPMDLDRVGIWGHSGGGFATAAAMFNYPDFFKVGISESGNHDNRNYEDDWGERYDGLIENSDYAAHANQLYAKNLKGKLLLAHGLLDDNVPPQNTLLVVEALEKANKDYDLIVFPNSRHGYGAFGPYMMRRRWDYFVENLMGKKHPKEFPLKGAKQD
ncbi:MAG: S9 family peptidase [Bacteroidetes bacterium]|nr:S9 family peptidase [Bacteroidota bacterium]MBU1374216.1 S9 family peptidase [Bacteroidota bacterium]MBU1485928.1 S9 family peptidase [Bacteroidota bacterium]MBU1759455.1 S9 family peptidase [Bacteroidota bacterium]MBU2267015.1 S9 family peptidase [Bacteroidota bacterium]